MSAATRTGRPWRAAVLLLLGWGAPTAWLGIHHTRLSVDVENRALKSIGTREATDMDRMLLSFGSDHAVLLGFAASPGLELSADELAAVEVLGQRLAASAGVAQLEWVEACDPGLRCARVLVESCPGGEPFTAVASRVARAARAACPPTLELHATGQPLAELEIAAAVDRERATIVPAVAVSLFALLWLLYRSLRIATAILMPAGVGILWTGGVRELLGHRADPVAVLLDPVLLTVGVAVSVHLVEAFVRHRAAKSPRAAAAAVRDELWLPTLLATVTTMIGFASLLLSPIPAVRSFGVFASFGVAIAACCALWCVPTWLAMLAPKVRAGRRSGSFVPRYVGWLLARRHGVLVTAALATVAMLVAASRVELDNDPLRVLRADSTLRRDTDWIVDRLGGIETFGLLVPADSGARDAAWLTLLASIASAEAGVVGLAGQPLLAANGSILLSAVLAPSGSTERERLFDAVERCVADFGFPEVHAVGSAVQIARDSGSLIRGQLASLALVVPLLGLVVAIGLRSLRLGLLSVVPNALPCALLQGGMAIVDRPLSVATVMIGTAMMGVIVDDTIHLLHRFRDARNGGRSRRRAVADAFATAGRPIAITSVVLAIGLGVGVFGALESTVEFSALAAATIVVAWVLDVVVLPALLLTRGRVGPALRQETS